MEQERVSAAMTSAMVIGDTIMTIVKVATAFVWKYKIPIYIVLSAIILIRPTLYNSIWGHIRTYVSSQLGLNFLGIPIGR